MSHPIWTPTPEQQASSLLRSFIDRVNENHALQIAEYQALHAWSIDETESFWSEVWDFCGVVGDRGERVVIDGDRMPGAQFFPDARLNFAENLLRRSDASDAMVFWGEDDTRSRMSWSELQNAVSSLSQAFREWGVEPGDRVAAIMPNMPETVVAMLAATSLGATWASCSPDFGEQGVLDRFGQIEPKVLIACDGYFYGGKRIDIRDKLAATTSRLPTVSHLVVVPYMQRATHAKSDVGDLDELASAVLYEDALASFEPGEMAFERVPFRHPLYILFSSGTTGVPKCIVHSVGGTLIQHLKEHKLQSDVKPGDRVFYFTTCTWMMWNWLVSALASEATLLLYDGSPFFPNANVLFDLADEESMTHFGTSAKFIDALKKAEVHPKDSHDLGSIRMIASTGSPLVPESFDFVYEFIKEDVYLASIAGGTDIVSCFVCGNPIGPIFRGEIPCAGLGMAVEVWDEKGNAVRGEKGELVCTRPFPSMPIHFWGDDEDVKYRAAYFERFPNVWTHGDFAEVTENGGVVILGRSDATLNPGGVRIGTAEIYRQVEQIEEVIESLAIGQAWEGDVRVVLFVLLRDRAVLTESLADRIRARVRSGATPRHVPAKIIQVSDIPRTKSGKIAELAVKRVVEGRGIENAAALANPECLELYRDLPELDQ